MKSLAEHLFQYYPVIKQSHMGLAILSGSLFALRGLCLLAGARWPRIRAVRTSSYAIDTFLLLLALVLVWILPRGYFANGWLLAKIILLPCYVVLGVMAFRIARSRTLRLACFVAALLVFVQMYLVARAHHPLGAFLYLRDLF